MMAEAVKRLAQNKWGQKGAAETPADAGLNEATADLRGTAAAPSAPVPAGSVYEARGPAPRRSTLPNGPTD